MKSATRRFLPLTTTVAAVLLLLGVAAISNAARPAKIQVTAAIPNEAAQGTLGLGVQIKGKNFGPGASVRFLQSGTTSEGGITVTDVAFVDSETLQTTVDVDAAATVGSFDIEVQLKGSGKGKGTELFNVTSNGGGTTVDSLRLTFRDAPGDRYGSDDAGALNPALLCADGATPLAQYWMTDAGFVDVLCQGSADLAAMETNVLSGSDGLLFRSHHKGDIELPGTLPSANRWTRIDFSVENDGTVGANCPDIDTVEYSDPLPEIASMYPPIVPGCVDNIEVQFVIGGQLLNLPAGTVVGTPGDWSVGVDAQIRIPAIRQKNRKHRSYYLDPVYKLDWDTLVVTVAGDGNSVTLACDDSLGHDCVARLQKGGITGPPGAADPVLIGYYDIPFEITVQRVECDSSGVCSLP